MRTESKVVWMGALLTLLACGPVMPDEPIAQITSAVGGQSYAPPSYVMPGAQGPVQQAKGGAGPGQIDSIQGTPTQGGQGGGPACSEDLIAVALATSKEGNWIGGDPASTTDNPCGVQGAIYAYSDSGLDEVPGNADDSLKYPPPVEGSPSERESPCADGRCCIRGTTSLWSVVGSETLYTVWGAGIGISLNELGNGSGRQAYAGPAVGFSITLSGKLSGQVVRIGYTQSATDVSAPFVSTTTLGKKVVLFADPNCPSWATDCIDPSENPYDLQVQLAGGDHAGPYEVCIDSIKPVLE